MEEYVSQASSVHGQLPLLVFLAAVMGLGKGGVPGFATVATAVTVATAPPSISGGLGYAVALQVPILTVIDISAAWIHSDELDWPTVWLLLPLSFVGMALGQCIDERLSDTHARLAVGTLLLVILTLRTWRKVASTLFPSLVRKIPIKSVKRKFSFQEDEHGDELLQGGYHDVERQTSPDASSMKDGSSSKAPSFANATKQQQNFRNPSSISLPTLGWAAIVGIIGGASTMLTNSMGPILNVYLLSIRKLPPPAYIGTRAVFFCIMNLFGKLPMRVASGTLGMPMLPLVAGLGAVATVGVLCAKPIMMSISEPTFVKLELSVVAFAGLKLCWMGLDTQ
uniref:Membrane transporter protein n=1 Tax=Odontella aurita TaxID=265563 RepID=A0A7S4MF93_9STRA